jgi:hypothetical protein
VYDQVVQNNVQPGAGELDSRLEGRLGRPLESLEWRTDLAWPPASAFYQGHARGLPGEPYLVLSGDLSKVEGYEPLKTRRLPDDFRVLARAVYPEPSATWPESDALAPWNECDPDQRIAVQTAILSFANRYGFLEKGGPVIEESGEPIGWGESLSYWTGELGIFRCLMAFVDGLGRAEKGGQLQRNQLDEQVEKIDGGKRLRLGRSAIFLDRSELVGRPFHVALRDRLRSFVRERVSISLAPLSKPLRFRPATVLSAVYLDLAMEMVGGLGPIRNCKYCGTQFRARNRRQEFHTATCRSKYRYHNPKPKGEGSAT